MVEKFKILSAGRDSKGLNIFKSSAYKEHEQTPMAQVFWALRWSVGVWLVCALTFCFSFIFEHIWRYGWSDATLDWIKIYLHNMMTSGGMSVIAEIPYWILRCVMHPDYACIVPVLPIIAYFFLVDDTLKGEFNPHGKDKFDKKSSREANEQDVEKMGLFKGFMMVLGYFKKKPLMLPKTLSVLCLAPPGTGKTEGIVLPTIFGCPGVSMIINDPKPELDGKSSAYRAAKVGPVFIMDWAGQDEPEKVFIILRGTGKRYLLSFVEPVITGTYTIQYRTTRIVC